MKKSTNPGGALAGLVIIAVIIFLIYQDSSRASSIVSPRAKNGVDTIYTMDSGYRIKFKIDTAFAVDREPVEPSY